MSLAPAKVRVEIFPSPGLFDDSFAKGWTATSGGFLSDGDLGNVLSGVGVVGTAEKVFSALDSDVYTEIVVRVNAQIGSWGLRVWDAIAGAWNTVWTGQTGTGLFEATLPAGKSITKIQLRSETASLSNQIAFDYVAICKNSLLVPDMGDLVEELRITRPLLNSGIAGAKLSIPNSPP